MYFPLMSEWFFLTLSALMMTLIKDTDRKGDRKSGTEINCPSSFFVLCFVRLRYRTRWCFWAEGLFIPPNLLKLIRTTVWPLVVNLPLPPMAGGRRGGERENRQRKEAKERGNGLVIPARIVMCISAGNLFISRFSWNWGKKLNRGYPMFTWRNPENNLN